MKMENMYSFQSYKNSNSKINLNIKIKIFINELSMESESFINLSGLKTSGSLKYPSCLPFKNVDILIYIFFLNMK